VSDDDARDPLAERLLAWHRRHAALLHRVNVVVKALSSEIGQAAAELSAMNTGVRGDNPPTDDRIAELRAGIDSLSGDVNDALAARDAILAITRATQATAARLDAAHEDSSLTPGLLAAGDDVLSAAEQRVRQLESGAGS
jgi:hypothetical protein